MHIFGVMDIVFSKVLNNYVTSVRTDMITLRTNLIPL